MLATAETVWLQLGPTMRTLRKTKKKGASTFSQNNSLRFECGDEPGLRVAVRSDVTQGLRMLKN